MKKVGIYDNRTEQGKREFYKTLQDLKPDEYVYEIKKNRLIRSIRANKFYWAVIQLYAMATGHTRKEIDNMFRMDRHSEVITYPSGKTQTIPKDTHETDTKEFAIICNNLLQWGREEFPQVIVPRQEDLTYVQLMQIENDYEKEFSGW